MQREMRGSLICGSKPIEELKDLGIEELRNWF
jgi:hypothetical protein